jgi:gamma-polyglutamate biosynthesis protein CapC
METLAIAIGIGLVVSLLFTEAFGLSVGGMIVPGYLAMSMSNPLSIVATIVAAMTTYGILQLVDRRAILFGRRRVVVTMVLGFAVSALMRMVTEQWTKLPLDSAGMSLDEWQVAVLGTTVIGFVIPGLIALWMSRIGIVRTVSPLVTATALVHLVLLLVGIKVS